MTPDTLEAGPELDALVARTLGLKCIPHGPEPRSHSLNPPLPYSRDWNAAMEAAEAVGLFDWKGHLLFFGKTGAGDWSFHSNWGHWLDERERHVYAIAPTGPLCICRAILEAKRE